MSLMVDPSQPPGRFVLRLAGLLAQLGCAGCLLVGTIAFVLMQQGRTGGSDLAIGWAGVAMLGIVCGGLMKRGAMFSVLFAALIAGGFGAALLLAHYPMLRGLLKILPESDVRMIAHVLTVGGVALVTTAVLVLAAIPQAVRYARWLHTPDAARSGATMQLTAVGPSETARGWKPASPTLEVNILPAPIPMPGYAPRATSVWHIPAAPRAEVRSRRRLYFALAGLAIGVGAGVGVLVSGDHRVAVASVAAPVAVPAGPSGSAMAAANERVTDAIAIPASEVVAPTANTLLPADAADTAVDGTDAAAAIGASISTVPAPALTAAAFLDSQIAALSSGDLATVTGALAPDGFGFGIDGDEVATGKDALAAQLVHDLGEHATISTIYRGAGADGDHAWLALELAVTAGDRTRKVAVTEAAHFAAGAWVIDAWHWAELIPDDTAVRMAILGTLPRVATVPDHAAAPPQLAAAVTTAFGNKLALLALRSAHPQAINIGSGPAQRVVGGERIRARPNGGKWRIKPRDGIRIVATGPAFAYAALALDFTTTTRAATDVTQPLRMLAILHLEPDGWRVVSAQWSNGGPIR